MLKTFPPYLRALAVITAVLLISYVAQFYYNALNLNLVNYYDKPHFEDTAGNRISSAKSGEPVVVRFYVERNSPRCYATYIQVLRGPVVAQFGQTRSQIVTNTLVHVEVPQLYRLPEGLPKGRYDWKQVVYPVCGGVEQTPFSMDIGKLDITD